MTSRLLYEGVLIELNKENAPNILLEDFNYFANKAINNYINKRYNIYDVNQQTTDDLRVLKATALLPVEQVSDYNGMTMAGDAHMATYEAIMPSDYLHILNCICIYKVNKTYKCYNKNDHWRCAATRLTADMYSQVLDNFWNKPTYKRPYYYIHNVNISNIVPTNPWREVSIKNMYSNTSGNTNNNSNTSDAETIDQLPTTKTYTVLRNMKEMIVTIKFTYSPTENFNNDHTYNIEVSKEVKTQNNGIWALVQIDRGDDIDNYNCDENKLEVWNPETGNWETVTCNIGTYVGKLKTSSTSSTSSSNSGTVNIRKTIRGTDSQSENLTINVNPYNRRDNNGNVTSDEYNYGTDGNGNNIVQGTGLPRSIHIGNTTNASNVERGQAIRYGNVSEVRLEIRYGTDNQVFELEQVYVDYIKAPQNIRLTQLELDLTEDTSQMLEYPDYVCQEIINELVHLVMENISDLRLQTHPVVSLSIANPAQTLTPQAQG